MPAFEASTMLDVGVAANIWKKNKKARNMEKAGESADMARRRRPPGGRTTGSGTGWTYIIVHMVHTK